MTQYADYQYFINKYLQDQEYVPPFDQTGQSHKIDLCLIRASAIIDRYTFGNIKKLEVIPDCVKHCCCRIAQRIYEFDKNFDGAVVSEKVGDLSTTFESPTVQKANFDKENVEIIKMWLAGTGLLYRGVN